MREKKRTPVEYLHQTRTVSRSTCSFHPLTMPGHLRQCLWPLGEHALLWDGARCPAALSWWGPAADFLWDGVKTEVKVTAGWQWQHAWIRRQRSFKCQVIKAAHLQETGNEVRVAVPPCTWNQTYASELDLCGYLRSSFILIRKPVWSGYLRGQFHLALMNKRTVHQQTY